MIPEPAGEVAFGPEAEGFIDGVDTQRDAVAGEHGLQVLERTVGQPHAGAEADLVEEIVDVGALLPVLDSVLGALLARHADQPTAGHANLRQSERGRGSLPSVSILSPPRFGELLGFRWSATA